MEDEEEFLGKIKVTSSISRHSDGRRFQTKFWGFAIKKLYTFGYQSKFLVIGAKISIWKVIVGIFDNKEKGRITPYFCQF